MKTRMTSLGMWTLEFNDDSHTFEKKEEVLPFLSELLESQPSGRALVSEDIGARSWFATFLGLAPRLIQMRFAVEWCDDVASLIFFNEADSEYRAMDPKHPVVADEATRKECLALDRARMAMVDFMKSGGRPEWMAFKYVR